MLQNKKLKILLPLLAFAAVGVYFVYSSQALWTNVDGPWEADLGNIHYDSSLQQPDSFSANPDQVFSFPVTGDFNHRPEPSEPWKLLMHFRSDSNRMDYLGFECGNVGPCMASNWVPANGEGGEKYVKGRGDLSICMNAPLGVAINTNLTFITLKYRLTKAGSFVMPEYYGFATGTCEQDPNVTGLLSPYKNTACYNRGTETADQATRGCSGPLGEEQDVGPQLPGNPNLSQGTNKQSNGSGGGGGSSAKRQSNDPNSLPSSSGQGDADNPEIEPSPFFDGKEFKPGSDKDTLASTVKSTGKKLARTWPLITAVVVLGGIAGYGYWHKKRRPHS